MLDRLDQMQVSTIVPLLSSLLKSDDFRVSLQEGQQCFQDGMFWEDHDKAWTEDDIIALVEGELSSEQYRREQSIHQAIGQPSLSYLHRLGFVVSYLDQALAAQGQ